MGRPTRSLWIETKVSVMLVLVSLFLFAPSGVQSQYISLTGLHLRLPGRCMYGEFDCGFGSCVPVTAFHNGQPDCRDGSDEWCFFGQIKCGSMCVNFLDSHSCKRKDEDGRNCNITQPFPCKGYGQIVSMVSLMDGKKDCYDSSDEDAVYVKTLEGSFRCWYDRIFQPDGSTSDLQPDKSKGFPSDGSHHQVVEFGNFITPIENNKNSMIVPIQVGNNELDYNQPAEKVPTTRSSMVLGSIVYSRYMHTTTPSYYSKQSELNIENSANAKSSFYPTTTPKPLSNVVEVVNQETEFFPESKIVGSGITDFFGEPITPINGAEKQNVFRPQNKPMEKTHDKIDVWVFPGQVPKKPLGNEFHPSPIDEESELEFGSSSKNKYEVLEPFKPIDNSHLFKPVDNSHLFKPITPAKVVVIKPLLPSGTLSSSSSPPSVSVLSSSPVHTSLSHSSSSTVLSTTTIHPITLITNPEISIASTEVSRVTEPDWKESEESAGKPTISVATKETVENNVKHLNIGGDNEPNSGVVVPVKTVDVSSSESKHGEVDSKIQKVPARKVPVEEEIISSTIEPHIDAITPESESQTPDNTEKDDNTDGLSSPFPEGCYENVMNNLDMSKGLIPICVEKYESEEGPHTMRHVNVHINTVCGRNVSNTKDVEDALILKYFENENASLCRNTFDENIVTILCYTCDFDNLVKKFATGEITIVNEPISASSCTGFESIITSKCIKCMVMDGTCGCVHACSISSIGWLLIVLGVFAIALGCCWLYNFCRKIERMDANWFTDIYDKIKFWYTSRTQSNSTTQNGQQQGNNQQTMETPTGNENGTETNKSKKFVAPRKHATSSRGGDGASTSVAFALPTSTQLDPAGNNESFNDAPNTVFVKPKKDVASDACERLDTNQIEPLTQIPTDQYEQPTDIKKDSIKVFITDDEQGEPTKKISPPNKLPLEIDNMIETAVLTSIAREPTISTPGPNIPSAESKRNSIERNGEDKTMWESFKEGKHTGERIHSSSSLEQTIIEAKPEIVRKWRFSKRRPTSKERRRCRVGYVPPLTPKKTEPEVKPAVLESPSKSRLEEPITVSEGSTDNLMTSNDKRALIDLSKNNINLENPFAKFKPKRVRSQSRSVPNILKTSKYNATFRSTETSPSRSFKQDMLTEAVGPEINERSQTEFINFASSANRKGNSSTAYTVIENHPQSKNATENVDHVSRSLPTKSSEIGSLIEDVEPRRRSTSRKNRANDADITSAKTRAAETRTANSLQPREETVNKGYFSTRYSGRSFLKSSQSTIIERRKNATADSSSKNDTNVEKPKRKSRSRPTHTADPIKSSNVLSNYDIVNGRYRPDKSEKANLPSSSRTALNTASTSNDTPTYHRHIMQRNLSRQRRDRHESSTQKYHRTKEELWWDN